MEETHDQVKKKKPYKQRSIKGTLEKYNKILRDILKRQRGFLRQINKTKTLVRICLGLSIFNLIFLIYVWSIK